MSRRFRLALALTAILGLAAPAYRIAASAGPGERTVHIRIHFSRYTPDVVDVRPGETVRFVVENTDPIDHEFLVGDREVQRIHEKGTEPSHPPRPGEMSVPAGTTRVTTYTFPSAPGSLIFACHLPGHYAYGMRGTITIA
ncbi:MAG TPA: plastocyanin/azurin family copper-binding protein [Actinomycetota bacterium]